jgi:ArsR family transcriptional regulator
MKAEHLSRAFKALGHPLRLRIVSGLIQHECNVKKMTIALDVPQATVSQQLAVLRSSGVVVCERRGNQVCYRVVKPWLKRMVRLVALNDKEEK